MSETEQEKEKRVLEELKGKNVAYYQVMLSAWIQSRMERDKTIITLSSWAIGLFVTLLIALYNKITLKWGLWFLATLSILAFGIAIFTCLHIYQKNAEYIENQLREKDGGSLKEFDKFSFGSFFIGIVFFVSFVLIISFNSKEENMANKDTSKEDLKESIQWIQKLAPKEIHTGSLDGVSNISPQNLNPQKPTGTPQSNSEQTNNTNNSGSKE